MSKEIQRAAKITGLAEDELTSEQAQEIIMADCLSIPTKITVTIEHARTTKVQYNTNRYSTSLEIDLTSIKEILIKKSYPNNEALMKDARIVSKLVMSKIRRAEQAIHDTLREAEEKDGIAALPGTRPDRGGA